MITFHMPEGIKWVKMLPKISRLYMPCMHDYYGQSNPVKNYITNGLKHLRPLPLGQKDPRASEALPPNVMSQND